MKLSSATILAAAALSLVGCESVGHLVYSPSYYGVTAPAPATQRSNDERSQESPRTQSVAGPAATPRLKPLPADVPRQVAPAPIVRQAAPVPTPRPVAPAPPPQVAPAPESPQVAAAPAAAPSQVAPTPTPQQAAAPAPTPRAPRASGVYNAKTGKIEWKSGGDIPPAPTATPAKHRLWPF